MEKGTELIKKEIEISKREAERDIELIKQITKSVLKELDKKNKKEVYHNTKVLMENYNDLKKHIENAAYDIEGLKKEDIVEVKNINQEEMYIYSIRKSKVRTLIMLNNIDTALNILKNEYKKEEYKKYEAFVLFYIKDLTYKEISDKTYCSESTVKRYIKEILNKLAILLFGLDALKIV